MPDDEADVFFAAKPVRVGGSGNAASFAQRAPAAAARAPDAPTAQDETAPPPDAKASFYSNGFTIRRPENYSRNEPSAPAQDRRGLEDPRCAR